MYIFVYIYIIYSYVHDLLKCTLLRSLVAISVFSISQVFPVMGVFKSKLASQQLATNKALAGWSSKWELLWLEDLLCKKRYCFFRFGKNGPFFMLFPKKSCSSVGTFNKWWTAMLKRNWHQFPYFIPYLCESLAAPALGEEGMGRPNWSWSFGKLRV